MLLFINCFFRPSKLSGPKSLLVQPDLYIVSFHITKFLSPDFSSQKFSFVHMVLSAMPSSTFFLKRQV